MAERLREAGGSAVHVYDARFLHVTVASPIVFFSATEAYPTPEAREAATTALVTAMDTQCTPANGFVEKQFEIKAVGVERRDKAIIVLFEDEGGLVERCRDCVEGLRSNEELQELGIFDAAIGGFKMPRGIVHMTVARFVSQPATPGSKAEEEWCKAVDKACAVWTAVSVTVDQIRLVNESMPYMHTDIVANTTWSRDLA